MASAFSAEADIDVSKSWPESGTGGWAGEVYGPPQEAGSHANRGIYVRLQIALHNQFLFAKDSFSAMMIT
jgi:hypothetical protein